jgi:hypothetical protein
MNRVEPTDGVGRLLTVGGVVHDQDPRPMNQPLDVLGQDVGDSCVGEDLRVEW